MAKTRAVRVGCEFRYTAAVQTPAVVQVQPYDSGPAVLQRQAWESDPDLPRRGYSDLYGNGCQRLTLPAGSSTLRYDALVTVPDATEEVDFDAVETPVAELPDDALVYTMPSRYVLSDVLGDEAWRLFGATEPGYRRVAAICDHVNSHLTFEMGSSTPLTTAADVYAAGRGVCRDFAHVALSFCRALNIPARYVFGYLPEIEVPAAAGADGLRRLDRGLSGRHLVHVRPAEQRGPQGSGADRPGPGRARRGHGDDVRGPGPGAHGGVGGGGGGSRRARRPGRAHRADRGGRPRGGSVTGWLDQPLLDLDSVDLDGPGPVRYLLHQRFRYDYDGPAYDVHQRLVAVPRERHGALRRRAHLVSVSVPGCVPDVPSTARADRDGNLVVRVRLPVVERSVEFTAAAVLERTGPTGDAALPAAALTDARHLRPTRLTRPDAALRALAAELRAAAPDDADFAVAACARLRTELDFAFEATSVSTTAAEAYATRRGVCQDFAHIMLATCRAAGVPARYVSGHLLGQEGGSHAWVEVLVADGPRARAVPVDPTNGGHVGPRHLPVAVGRDYADVAPTSGVYSGSARGRLTWIKRAGVTAVGDLAARQTA